MSSGLHDWSGEDRVLVERCQAGDLSAFGTLYERHHPRLVRYVRRRVYERDVIEDLVQEAFAKALAGLSELRNPARFYPWLTVIARNLIIRHRQLRGQVSPVAQIDTLSDEAVDTDLLRRLELEDLQRALARVRKRHRDILQMREREELSYDDIALRMNTPATTIPPLLFRARQALRREYLAITDEDRKLHGIGAGIVLALHRLRARANRFAVWCPDVHALCASAACVVIAVGGLSFDPPAPTHSAPKRSGVYLISEGSIPPLLSSSSGERPSTSVDVPGGTSESDPRADRPDLLVPGVAHAGVNNPARTNRTREEARRNMPIYQEFGPAGFAADPDRMRHDLESMLPTNSE